jgi:glucose-6-phosphate 1-dehydrogenase
MKLFIFGSTGDLVKRKVLPALQTLQKKDLEIWAIGRRDFTHEIYKDFVCSNQYSIYFRKRLNYLKINFEKQNLCKSCENILDKNKINYFYISMPPKYADKILISLSKLKEKGFKIKILIEKPFGENLKHAKILKKIIQEKNLEKDIFLSDHYLFKKNILNAKKINAKKIKIISIEKLGLENRTTYYDNVGALNDMIQNHFFNILFKLLKNSKKEIKSLKIVDYIKAQYGNGINTGYVKELGKKSQTETFVYLKLKTNKQEFIFITGKAFNKKQSQLKLDNKSLSLNSKNPYESLFLKFFSEKKEFFPTISNAILSWEIIEKINSKKPKLKYYQKNSSLNQVLNKKELK